MSDKDIFEKPKPKRKRELTEQQREKLCKQLAEGRKKALLNRQRASLLKKIDKEAEEEEKNKKIARAVLKKNPLEDEVKLLREEISGLKLSMEVRKKEHDKKEVIEVTKVETKKEADATPKEVSKPEPSKPIPVPTPKPQPKVFSRRARYLS